MATRTRFTLYWDKPTAERVAKQARKAQSERMRRERDSPSTTATMTAIVRYCIRMQLPAIEKLTPEQLADILDGQTNP